MKKTLLLVFIHGFKGGETTFGENYLFTEHLRDLVARQLPKVDIQVLVYPKYETRGQLQECVARFRDWLLEKVIDIEVSNSTPSPTVDPHVRTILIGHSMGGMVAAETVIGLASEKPISDPPASTSASTSTSTSDRPSSPSPSVNGLMFPYIQGVLAFDTPYLGIHPGVVAHGAEGHLNTFSSTYSQLNELSNSLWGSKSSSSAASAAASASKPVAALPAPPSSPSSGWGKWGSMAMYAAGAAAVAGAGAAAYVNREHLTTGWTWATSHLEFVGTLARAEELKARVARMVRLQKEPGVGFANLYTRLGASAGKKSAVVGGGGAMGQESVVKTWVGGERTFCNLPTKAEAGIWKQAVNDKAEDETGAHMTMFEEKENPGYWSLAEDAAGFIVEWSRNEWYEGATAENPALLEL